MSQNVAICLFVKDEFSDIAGWIAWHAALGVKTFFIYDDHSTDGTWDILQAAAKCYDLRLRRTDPFKVPHFADRQRDAYMQTAQEAKGEFDWLGFLDGDEYLYLRHFDKVTDFLEHFSHADAIGFSWRIYGSSGRVVRPRISIIEAFTHHSTKDFSDNAHIKSFIRPHKMGPKWIDPHCFDIPQENYVAPSGKFLKIFGPRQEVEWSDGFVMHFICRSMEHYVQRVKRRLDTDIADSTDPWHYYDRNDLYETEPLRLLGKMREMLAPIQGEALKMAIQKLKDLPITPDSKLYSKKASEHKVTLFKIITHTKTELYYAPQLSQAVHCTPEIAEKNHFTPIFGMIDSQTKPLLMLFVEEDPSCSLLTIPQDTRSTAKLLYRIIPQKDGNIGLANPRTKQFICFLPVDEAGIGRLEANRDQAHDWEKASLKIAPDAIAPFTLEALPFNVTDKISAHAVLNWIKTASALPHEETFLRVFYCLSPHVQQEILNYVPGLL
ncbi:hypothetical protein RF55_18583 [Lasius niger]|uniref:Glycosyltransferase family 92 protein n=1 Tax=Lasius niger TaxID=67767 RepID=A0A0J7K1E9_LASNI|nr:hypothetical protein RF55_18583 [Lasius niger]